MSPPSRDFLVVGIGASAGGVEALHELFAHIPATSGCAYVVILHLSPEHESHLADILQHAAAIPVTPVSERVRVEPDHVYVVPPSRHLTMADGEIVVSPTTRPEERRSPIDLFFRTLAVSHGAQAVCVVLSGTGADGSLGLKQVKECGGAVFVQDPCEAAFGEMPRSAVATGQVDDVLPVAGIAARIVAYQSRLGRLSAAHEPGQHPEGPQPLREIFALLRARTGNDFSDYKRDTMLRRLEHRIAVLGLTDLAAYAAFLGDHPNEAPALLTSLMISVTSFFRDGDAFAALAHEVLPRIFAGKGPGEQIRIWVVGCATGEEAYSIAMLCAERTADVLDAPGVQIFSTDIDPAAIARARQGLYTACDMAGLSPERLRRFFVREDGHFRVRRELRELILFATHNLLTDPPFAHLDLIACRNVLIYLNRTAQQRAVETLHFALNPGGFLFLGSAEGPDGYGDPFVTVSRKDRLFQRPSRDTQPLHLPASLPPAHHTPPLAAPRASAASEQAARGPITPIDLHQRLLEQYAPPSLIVTPDYEVVHVSPRAARYLRMAAGEPTTNLLLLLRPELLALAHAALSDAVQRRVNVDTPLAPLRVDDHDEQVAIRVRPVLRPDDAAQGYILILFDTDPTARPEAEVLLRAADPAMQLPDEVTRLREELRTSSAQYEYQAEMLRAANEELQALNEELRTSGEELEASKEELQSVNEELRTVNQELKVKIEEATLHSTHLQNLINSAEVGTIFLDRGLVVQLFTPAACRLFNLIAADRGRPLSDITHRMVEVDLLADAEQVLRTLQTVEREVHTSSGEVYMLRVLPYQVGEGRVGGVVLTFFETTERKRAEAQVQAALEAERAARRDAEVASGRTARLQAMTASLADALTLDDLLRVISEHSVVATGAAAVVVGLLDAAGEQLDIAGWFGREAPAAERRALPLSAQAPPALAARSGEPVWLSSREEAEARFPGFGEVLAGFGDHALASLPLMGAEHVGGALSFAYTSPRSFTPDEQTFLLALAQQCAQALERARLYAQLLASQEQLRHLSQRLLEAQEEERRALARELHDEIGQELTGLRLALQLIAREPPVERDKHLAEASRTTQDLIARIRAISLDLRPAMLDDSGLLPALLWLIRRFRERTGIVVELHHQGLEARLPSAVETVAYRVVQEALTNIARHAGVGAATINVLASSSRLLVQVQDAGRGFILGATLGGDRSSGLAGMQERVGLLGGTLSIESEPGGGTWLTVELPLSEEAGP